MARARTAAGKKPPQNPPETEAKPARVIPIGKRFEEGNRANPGGRPKGLAKRVRERVGGDGDALITVMLAISTNVSGKEKTADVIRATEWLADRGWGKAPIFAPVEEVDPLEMADAETEELAAALDQRLDELAARRTKGKPKP